jgi:hypothetical protein
LSWQILNTCICNVDVCIIKMSISPPSRLGGGGKLSELKALNFIILYCVLIFTPISV